MNPTPHPSNNSEAAIFEAALACATPQERAVYLDKACAGRPELRQRVEALLAAHDQASKFLEPAPNAAPTIRIELPGDESPGDVIGQYKIREKIGEGGCGVVYVADQEQPVRRRVALKVVKLGMDTKQVVARFEAERQALALMDHPNIAKVLDAGATSTGRPFFVMELVRGIKITDYCDQNNLSTEERLKLFIQVCHAVQHAHQKGIIHRDIKPSNVLVTLHDGVPVPKVIDFGIAKATSDQRLTDKTIYTAFEQFLGTPAYMSPEQAEMSGLDIDTRSDIYSLGVLLYELLTGNTPFDPKTLMQAGIDQMRRIIREQEPPRPSTRLSTLTHADLTTLAKQRHAEAPKLINLISGDLDWIVMKCLEKDRTRRYETANGLAVEINRHLNNETIIARPPSALYRIQKTVRRNKLACASTVIVLATLLLGLTASIWSAAKASRAEIRKTEALAKAEAAQAEEAEQRRRADQNATAERIQRQKAEDSARKMKEVLSRSLTSEGNWLANEKSVGKALAYFANAVRLDPNNNVAATRIVSMLNQRDFPLPLLRRPESFESPLSTVAEDRHLAVKGTTVVEGLEPREVSRLQTDGQPYRSVFSTFSADGRMVAISDSSKRTQVFYTQSGEPVLPPIAVGSPYAAPEFTPDSRCLIAGYKSIEVWDLVTKKQSYGTPTPMDSIFAIRCSPDGRSFAMGIRSRETRLLSAKSGEVVREPCIGSGTAYDFEWSAHGEFLASSELDRNITNQWKEHCWDVRVGRAIPITIRNNAPVYQALFSPTGHLVATVGSNGIAGIWRSEDGLLVSKLPLTNFHTETVAFSPDSFEVAIGSSSGEVGIWDIRLNKLLWRKQLHSKRVISLLFSPDGKTLFSGAGNKYNWDVKDECAVIFSDCLTGQTLGQITNKHGAIEGLDVTKDGRRLAVAYKNYRAEIWDVEAVKLVGKPLTANQGWVWHVKFSPDNRWLVTSSGGDAAQVWDTQSVENKPVQVFSHESGVLSSEFNSNADLVLTCSQDATARVWERSTGRPVTQPLIHTARVKEGCFSPSNKEVLSCSEDGTAVIWDIETSRALCEPFLTAQGQVSAAFNPQGTHLLVAGADGNVKIYRWLAVRSTAPAWLPKLAEAIGGYRLNEKQIVERVIEAPEMVEGIKSELTTLSDTDELVRWGQWYLSDRWLRKITDCSKISVRDYSRKQLDDDNLASVEEAVTLDSKNPTGYERLATFVEAERPETATLYRNIAARLK